MRHPTYLEEEVRGHLGHLADDVVVGRDLSLLGVGGIGLAGVLFPPAVAPAYHPLDLDMPQVRIARARK